MTVLENATCPVRNVVRICRADALGSTVSCRNAYSAHLDSKFAIVHGVGNTVIRLASVLVHIRLFYCIGDVSKASRRAIAKPR